MADYPLCICGHALMEHDSDLKCRVVGTMFMFPCSCAAYRTPEQAAAMSLLGRPMDDISEAQMQRGLDRLIAVVRAMPETEETPDTDLSGPADNDHQHADAFYGLGPDGPILRDPVAARKCARSDCGEVAAHRFHKGHKQFEREFCDGRGCHEFVPQPAPVIHGQPGWELVDTVEQEDEALRYRLQPKTEPTMVTYLSASEVERLRGYEARSAKLEQERDTLVNTLETERLGHAHELEDMRNTMRVLRDQTNKADRTIQRAWTLLSARENGLRTDIDTIAALRALVIEYDR